MQNNATASAHTKGPWIVSTSTNSHVYDGEEHLVILSHPMESTAQILADIETLPEAEANARLIAAAPELLRYLEVILDEYATNAESAWESSTAVDLAMDVIARTKLGYQKIERGCDCEFHQCTCEWPELKTPPTQAT